MTKPDLTPEQRQHLEEWVAALRSGDYAQVNGVLHNESGYCCLGVACDLYVKDHENAAWDGEGYLELDGASIGSPGDDLLPEEVALWLGLPTGVNTFVPGVTNVELKDGEQMIDATVLNDVNNWSFGQIADAIERTYLS